MKQEAVAPAPAATKSKAASTYPPMSVKAPSVFGAAKQEAAAAAAPVPAETKLKTASPYPPMGVNAPSIFRASKPAAPAAAAGTPAPMETKSKAASAYPPMSVNAPSVVGASKPAAPAAAAGAPAPVETKSKAASAYLPVNVNAPSVFEAVKQEAAAVPDPAPAETKSKAASAYPPMSANAPSVFGAAKQKGVAAAAPAPAETKPKAACPYPPMSVNAPSVFGAVKHEAVAPAPVKTKCKVTSAYPPMSVNAPSVFGAAKQEAVAVPASASAETKSKTAPAYPSMSVNAPPIFGAAKQKAVAAAAPAPAETKSKAPSAYPPMSRSAPTVFGGPARVMGSSGVSLAAANSAATPAEALGQNSATAAASSEKTSSSFGKATAPKSPSSSASGYPPMSSKAPSEFGGTFASSENAEAKKKPSTPSAFLTTGNAATKATGLGSRSRSGSTYSPFSFKPPAVFRAAATPAPGSQAKTTIEMFGGASPKSFGSVNPLVATGFPSNMAPSNLFGAQPQSKPTPVLGGFTRFGAPSASETTTSPAVSKLACKTNAWTASQIVSKTAAATSAGESYSETGFVGGGGSGVSTGDGRSKTNAGSSAVGRNGNTSAQEKNEWRQDFGNDGSKAEEEKQDRPSAGSSAVGRNGDTSAQEKNEWRQDFGNDGSQAKEKKHDQKEFSVPEIPEPSVQPWSTGPDGDRRLVAPPTIAKGAVWKDVFKVLERMRERGEAGPLRNDASLDDREQGIDGMRATICRLRETVGELGRGTATLVTEVGTLKANSSDIKWQAEVAKGWLDREGEEGSGDVEESGEFPAEDGREPLSRGVIQLRKSIRTKANNSGTAAVRASRSSISSAVSPSISATATSDRASRAITSQRSPVFFGANGTPAALSSAPGSAASRGSDGLRGSRRARDPSDAGTPVQSSTMVVAAERPGLRLSRVVGAQYDATLGVETWMEKVEARVQELERAAAVAAENKPELSSSALVLVNGGDKREDPLARRQRLRREQAAVALLSKRAYKMSGTFELLKAGKIETVTEDQLAECLGNKPGIVTTPQKTPSRLYTSGRGPGSVHQPSPSASGDASSSKPAAEPIPPSRPSTSVSTSATSFPPTPIATAPTPSVVGGGFLSKQASFKGSASDPTTYRLAATGPGGGTKIEPKTASAYPPLAVAAPKVFVEAKSGDGGPRNTPAHAPGPVTKAPAPSGTAKPSVGSAAFPPMVKAAPKVFGGRAAPSTPAKVSTMPASAPAKVDPEVEVSAAPSPAPAVAKLPTPFGAGSGFGAPKPSPFGGGCGGGPTFGSVFGSSTFSTTKPAATTASAAPAAPSPTTAPAPASGLVGLSTLSENARIAAPAPGPAPAAASPFGNPGNNDSAGGSGETFSAPATTGTPSPFGAGAGFGAPKPSVFGSGCGGAVFEQLSKLWNIFATLPIFSRCFGGGVEDDWSEASQDLASPLLPDDDVEVSPSPNSRREDSAASGRGRNLGHFQGKRGDVLANRYELVADVGSGTFGRVIGCWDVTRQSPVAVKVIRKATEYHESALGEAQVLRDVNAEERDQRPNKASLCVELFGHFEHQGHHCLVFECLGISLYEYSRQLKNRRFPMEIMRPIARELLQAIEMLHSMTLTHADLKPENVLLASWDTREVMLDSDDDIRELAAPHIKVIDFGSAVYENGTHAPVTGTRPYRAPEVILGMGWLHPLDLWSIGCIIAELFLGHVLFTTYDDLEHLALIEKCLGQFPSEMLHEAPRTEDFFDVDTGMCWGATECEMTQKYNIWRTKRLQDITAPAENTEFGALLEDLLKIDPASRATASQALSHGFFKDA